MDFSGQNLRGRNFRGQDLTGANFSHADIRGANFSNAILREANFTGAKAGLQRRWVACPLLISLALSFLSGTLSGFFSLFVAHYFRPETIAQSTIIPAASTAILYLILFIAITRQGFTLQTFGTIAFVVSIGVAFATGVTFAFNVKVTVTVAVAGVGAVISAVLGDGAVLGAISSAIIAAMGFIFVSAVVALASGVSDWRAFKGDKKFALVRTIAITFGAIGGTSFCGADLTDADFTKAILKSTNFNHTKQKQTILHQVC